MKSINKTNLLLTVSSLFSSRLGFSLGFAMFLSLLLVSGLARSEVVAKDHNPSSLSNKSPYILPDVSGADPSVRKVAKHGLPVNCVYGLY